MSGVSGAGSAGPGVTGFSSMPGETSPGGEGAAVRAPEQASEDKSAGSSSENPRQEKENPQGLTESELKELTELKARDREVRAHEAAHQAVGGQHAGAISYSYERGPDGAQYAVGGEVPIDVSPVAGDPQATIEKMRVVRAAAMAPAQPSSQDRAVAAQAMQTMLQAQVELASGDKESSIDGGADGAGQARNAQDTSSRQATEAYQSVSTLQGYGFDSDTATSIFV
ncbi:putative metalloprotease CJM1_0395 family protein [Marinobacter sp. MDS2]|nr:putative metalloprotease CJM1_0395 family protein [Marinobacter sp. MDS2]MDP4546971.1 putative metalloprotease CJM1_0395 family protein [Marinobacter sp. MDS2]